MIFQLLNTGDYSTKEERRRLWLNPGYFEAVSAGCIMELRLDREDDLQTPMLRLVNHRGESFEAPLPAGCHLDARPYARAWIIPRAAELDDAGRITRALIEVVDIVRVPAGEVSA